MKQFDKSEILELPKRRRAKLINSCSGLKSVNLIGSIDKDGNKNVAIFNSVVHLGVIRLCYVLC